MSGFLNSNGMTPKARNVIPPLRSRMLVYLRFYICELIPYLRQDTEILYAIHKNDETEFPLPNWLERESKESYFMSLFLDNIIGLGDSSNPVRQRYQAGMLREEQIKLLRVVLDGLLSELRWLLDQWEDSKDKLKDWKSERGLELWLEILKEIKRACLRSQSLLKNFLARKRFRSERLEVLLLKYLEEEGVNREVVRGVILADETSHSW